jgi:hypothetical protein
MRSTQTLGQNGARVYQSAGAMPVAVVPTTKGEIPYDYVATFALQGKRGNRVQDVINVSVEGAFVATAIGYSFIPPRLPDRTTELKLVKQMVQVKAESPGTPGASNLVAAVTNVAAVSNQPDQAQAVQNLVSDLFADPRMLVQCLLMHFCGIHFKYSIIDSGTGRELQNKAIHNIAGLGEATGDRPFRPLAKPILFEPRSTIRIEIEEISEDLPYAGAELFIVFQGYKILGYGPGVLP